MIVFCSYIFLHSTNANAEQPQRSTKTFKGINFNVPDDWPLEEQGGAIGPIPVEEYLILKFGKAEERFKKIEADMAKNSESYNSRLTLLEEQISEMNERLKDLEHWLKRGEARRLE